MEITRTTIDEVWIIEPKVYGDHRGWFTESYSKEKFKQIGIDIDFVQDNHSYSTHRGTLRGLHFQLHPKAQSKLVRCTKGKILDVAVDIRRGSPTYLRYVAVELSEENKKWLFIPKGFAHGFVTLTDDTEVQYRVDEYYAPAYDRSIRFDDPQINVTWGVDAPILSEKDLNAPFLQDSDAFFSLRVLVTGSQGQLGRDVVNRLRESGMDVIAATRHEFDITDKHQTATWIADAKPDVVVHCAAYTAVDQAEDDKETCYAVNVEGTRHIAEAIKAIHGKMVYISTDYVFDGSGHEPHPEDEPTHPINYYGYTKELGEHIVRTSIDQHYIIRTSWVCGAQGNNFMKTMLRLAKTRDHIDVVKDQVGAPTFTKDLAELICEMIQSTHYGTYHGVNEGYCSWYEFAQAIFTQAGISIQVNPISSSEYPTKAIRPLNSRLSKQNLDQFGFNRLPHWQEALTRYLEEMNPEE